MHPRQHFCISGNDHGCRRPGRLSTDAAELARALRASASPGAERATAPQVQRAIDELVQQSALYVVSDGPGAGQRTVRPT